MRKLLKKLNLVDWLNYAYFVYLTVALLVRWDRVPHAPLLLAAHAVYVAGMTVLALTVRPDSAPVLRFLRTFYQLICITFIYRETEYFMRLYHGRWLDPFVVALELKIFGVHPALWMERFVSPGLTEFFKFCYSSYFFLVPLVPLYLWAVKRPRAFSYHMFASTLALYACYVGFTLFPVQGPRYFFAAGLPAGELLTFPWEPNTLGLAFRNPSMSGGIFTAFVDLVMKNADSTGACIPSAHAAAAVVILGVFRRFIRKGFPFALPLICGILVSTVYNRYHYVTDLVTGIAAGVLALLVADRLFRDSDRPYIRG